MFGLGFALSTSFVTVRCCFYRAESFEQDRSGTQLQLLFVIFTRQTYASVVPWHGCPVPMYVYKMQAMSDALTAKDVCDIINRVTLPEGERRTQWLAFVNVVGDKLVGLPRNMPDEEVMEFLREYKAQRAGVCSGAR